MYEELNAPIPSIPAYLSRLGYEENTDCNLFPVSPDSLSDLVYAHQCHVPFDDLDSFFYHKVPSLGIQDLFQKIVTDRRGGCCFEMNGLFTRLLLDLGFSASSVFCRIIRGKKIAPTGFMPPCTHRAILVEFDHHLYFCDVGYGGPMPPFAVPVEDGAVAAAHGETFRTQKLTDLWWSLSRKLADGTWEEILHFNTTPQEASEFIPVNYYCNTFPEMIFVHTLLVNRRTPEGSVGIVKDTLTIRKNNEIHTQSVAEKADLQAALLEYFGISVSL